MKTIGTTVTLLSKEPIETVYRFIVDKDTPMKVVHSWGPVPGFESYRLLDGDWAHEGARRWVTLYDGSRALEQIETLRRPNYFDYRLTDFTNWALRFMAKQATGQWWFEKAGDGTHITWRYSVTPRSVLLVPFVFLFMKLIYVRFMKASMRDIAKIEQQQGLSPKIT